MKQSLDQYKNDIAELTSLQNLLLNLNSNNLQSTIESLKESKFLKTQDDLKILMRIISRIIKYRKKQLQCFFTLIEEIFPIISSKFNKKEVMLLFSQKILILKLYYDKYISNEDIVAFYGIKNSKIFYFYPEIKNLLSNNSIFNENIKECQRYKDIIEYFSEKNESEIDINNDPRFQVGNIDKLSVLIQKDDIDSFQQMISQNNINIKTHKIKLMSLESNKCLKDEKLYLIEYAAYHGSLKIFKFLLMNDSTFSNKLFKYAICGGNNEIIHLSEDKLSVIQDIESILMLTIIFHSNQLSEYLIENYDAKVNFGELSSSIYYENYEFFFNHLIELNDEYNELLNKQEEENEKLKKIQDEIKSIVVFSAGDYFTTLLKVVINFKNINLNDPLYFNFQRNQSDPITNPLIYSIQKFNNKNAKFLISLDSIDPDYKLFDDTTPFIWACYVGNIEMVEFLSKNKKVDVLRIVQQSNENSLHIATRQGNLNVVKFLVSLNVFDLSAKYLNGGTAIKAAARLGYKEIFDFLKWNLIKNGIEIGNDLKLNEEKYYPSRYSNPIEMGIEFFVNFEEPISVCLLI